VHWVVLQKSIDQVSTALAHMSWIGELNLKRKRWFEDKLIKTQRKHESL